MANTDSTKFLRVEDPIYTTIDPAPLVTWQDVPAAKQQVTPPVKELIARSSPLRSPRTVSVVTYNILANVFIKEATARYPQPSFPYVMPRFRLDFEARAPRIIERLVAIDADIICLQEVERFDYWKTELGKLGYDGMFSPRPNDTRNTGVATFWRLVKLTQRERLLVDFNEIGPTMWEASNVADYNAYKQNNSGLIMWLYFTEDVEALVSRHRQYITSPNYAYSNSRPLVNPVGQPVHFPVPMTIVVGNFHAYWDPKFPLVKLAQTKYMLDKMEWTVNAQQHVSSYTGAHRLRIILAGDFNSLPDSQVYAALNNEKVSTSYGIYEKSLSNSHEICSVLAASAAFEKNGANSAVAAAVDPCYTNYTHDFNGTLDYIWYSKNFVAKEILKLDTEEQLKAETGLPNHRQPSDHLPVAMRFEMSW